MKQDEEQKQGAAGDGAKKRRGWSDDPLSVFLLVGAVVLAVMYGLESRQSAEHAERGMQAMQFAELAGFESGGCTVGAMGARSEVLVVSCRGASVEKTLERLAAALREDRDVAKAGFERVYVGGQNSAGENESRVCALQGGGKEGTVLDVATCRVVEGRKNDASGAARGIAKYDAGDFGEFSRLGV